MPMKIISGIKLLTKTIILQNLLFSKTPISSNILHNFSQINKKPIRTSKTLEFALKFFSFSKPTWKTTSSTLRKKRP